MYLLLLRVRLHLLDGELVGPGGDAVDELYGAPEPVELSALVDIHDAVGGGGASPDRVVCNNNNT